MSIFTEDSSEPAKVVSLRERLAEWRQVHFQRDSGYSRIIEQQDLETARQFHLSGFWTTETNPIRSTARKRFGGWMEEERLDPPQGG